MAELIECNFNYALKMNIEHETCELQKVIEFEGPANELVDVVVNDLQLLLAKPNATQDIWSMLSIASS